MAASRGRYLALAILIAVVSMLAYAGFNTAAFDEVRIDLATMELETVRGYEVCGITVPCGRARVHSMVSSELARAGLTTGANGFIVCRRLKRGILLSPPREISSHSLVGQQMRNVALSIEIAESISRRGDTTLDELTHIVEEASDMDRYPNWTLSGAVVRMRKTERELPASGTQRAH